MQTELKLAIVHVNDTIKPHADFQPAQSKCIWAMVDGQAQFYYSY